MCLLQQLRNSHILLIAQKRFLAVSSSAVAFVLLPHVSDDSCVWRAQAWAPLAAWLSTLPEDCLQLSVNRDFADKLAVKLKRARRELAEIPAVRIAFSLACFKKAPFLQHGYPPPPPRPGCADNACNARFVSAHSASFVSAADNVHECLIRDGCSAFQIA